MCLFIRLEKCIFAFGISSYYAKKKNRNIFSRLEKVKG